MTPAGPGEAARAAFDDALARADEAAAVRVARELVAAGASAEEVLLGLVAPAQARVGDRWVAGEWTTAREHAATHVSEQVVAAVAAAAPVAALPAGVPAAVVVACVEGEWHSLPARMLAEVLRLRGFGVRFLGPAVRTSALVTHLHEHAPDLVALSCTLPVRLPGAHRMIEAARLAGLPVLAGGTGFGPHGVWARVLGADMWAPDAGTAADELIARRPAPGQGTPALGHLADREYARLARDRTVLLGRLVDRCRPHCAALASDDPERREAAVTDLGRVYDYLCAGVFVDDPRVLTAFLVFDAQVMTGRGVPTGSLRTAVRELAALVGDLPRAHAQVTAGLAVLADAAPGG